MTVVVLALLVWGADWTCRAVNGYTGKAQVLVNPHGFEIVYPFDETAAPARGTHMVEMTATNTFTMIADTNVAVMTLRVSWRTNELDSNDWHTVDMPKQTTNLPSRDVPMYLQVISLQKPNRDYQMTGIETN